MFLFSCGVERLHRKLTKDDEVIQICICMLLIYFHVTFAATTIMVYRLHQA